MVALPTKVILNQVINKGDGRNGIYKRENGFREDEGS